MIYLDTGAFLARYVPSDQFHKAAKKFWRRLARKGDRIFTSNFVLDELFTLLARKTNYPFASERANLIYQSDHLTILRPDESTEREALLLFQKFADQEISFTDCISFVLMKKNNLREVFTFDRHFSLAGFTVHP